MGNRGLNTAGTVLLLLGVCGCGLFKRSDATDAQALTRKMAAFVENGTDLTPSSNEVTELRLKTLFPDVPTIPEVTAASPAADEEKFNLAAFTPRFSKNLDRAMTAEG